VTDHIVTKHCLQAFNAKYFLQGGRLFSYSVENASAARALRMQEHSISGQDRLGEPGEEWRTLDAERLMEFLRSPAGFFLKNRLMVRLPREEATLQDREPFTLSGLDAYEVRRRLLAARLAGRDRQAVLALLKAEGVLPHGLPGEMVFREMDSEVETFHTLIKSLEGDVGHIRQDISIALDGFTVTGSIDTLPGSGYFSFRHANITPMDRLRAWISHLLLQANSPGQVMTSRHIGKDKRAEFAPVEDPKAVLGRILDVYWQGLSRPLHFFPKSSHAFVKAVRKSGKPEGKALKDAEKVWTGARGFTRAEADDAAHRICFGDSSPLDREFMDLSLAVFGPLMDHMTEGNL
jgi:exodeoxyribonuclease V gamma subunit